MAVGARTKQKSWTSRSMMTPMTSIACWLDMSWRHGTGGPTAGKASEPTAKLLLPDIWFLDFVFDSRALIA